MNMISAETVVVCDDHFFCHGVAGLLPGVKVTGMTMAQFCREWVPQKHVRVVMAFTGGDIFTFLGGLFEVYYRMRDNEVLFCLPGGTASIVSRVLVFPGWQVSGASLKESIVNGVERVGPGRRKLSVREAEALSLYLQLKDMEKVATHLGIPVRALYSLRRCAWMKLKIRRVVDFVPDHL